MATTKKQDIITNDTPAEVPAVPEITEAASAAPAEGPTDDYGTPLPAGCDPWSPPRKLPGNPRADIANAGTPEEPVYTMSRSVQAILEDVLSRPSKPKQIVVVQPAEAEEGKKQAMPAVRVDW